MLTEAITLDMSQARRQIDELERELNRLQQPVNVPVDIQGEQAADELRRDFSNADVAVADLNAELAETDRELDRIRTSSDRAGRELETAGRKGASSFNGMAVAAGAFGVALAAAVGVRAFVGFAGKAIDAASDFEEALSKSQVVFGEFSDEIEAFARTGPQALGLANREALAFTATFGNLFVALGLSQEAAAELSPEIVQLGADLASFNNIDVADALEKLRSGLVGEAEPLRALGVNINETVVNAKALELGLGGVNGELTEAEKVQARYALIVEQTATAQGDFARTADGIANTQRTLNAQWEDAQAALGEALLPAMQALLDLAPQLLASFEDMIPVFQALGAAIEGVDPSGLGDGLQLLTEIPQSAGSLLDIVTGVGGALAGMSPTVIALRGDFDLFADSLNQVDTALQGIENRKIINNLINDIQNGVAPTAALTEGLRKLGAQDLDPDQFVELAKALIQISGVKPDELNRLRNSLRPGFIGLDAEEVARLRTEFGLLTADLVTSPEVFRRINEEAERFADLDAIMTDTARAIRDAALAGEDLSEFAPTFDGGQFISAADDVVTAFDGAVQALQTDGEELVESFSGFMSDLDRIFSEQLDFERNIAILRDRGLDQLAEVFEEAGLAAAGALAEAVTDPTAAAQAEAQIEEQARLLAQADFLAFDTEIKQLIAGYDPDAVVIPLEFGPLPTLPTAPALTGVIPSTSGGDQRAGPFSQTIIFETEPRPTTDTQRIQQATSQITGAIRGVG